MKGNTAEYVILGMLSDKPMSGYDINKRVKSRMGSFWGITYSQIYPALKRLEKDGFLTKKLERNEYGPSRKVYSITSIGTKKLQEWLIKPAEPERARIETLLKVAYGEQISKKEVIKHIIEFKARNKLRLEKALFLEEEVKNKMNESERNFFLSLTIMLGKKLHKAGIEWADSAIELIEKT